MWRIEWYSTRMPLAPRSRRASRAHSQAMCTLFRLANGRRYEVAMRFGDGSEIEDIVLRS